MAKPTGSVCNLDCTYCFYLEKEALYPERKQHWKMSDETLERYIRQHIQAQETENVMFSWQGGEPTMMGLAFYHRVIALCEKYGDGKQIQHALQTNGMLITPEWAQFFARHQFLIGLSIDGSQHLHDTYRVTRAGTGTHSRVEAALELLKRYDVAFNTLTVVGKHNVNHAAEIYEYLLASGSRHLQFIPLVERFSSSDCAALQLVLPEETSATLTPWSVPSWQYGEFLSKIFDIWVRRDIGRVAVQMFDVAIAAWTTQPPVLCIHSKTCGHALALESNGDLYNCDHFVYPQHLLGNIHHSDIVTLNNSPQAIAFGQAKHDTLSPTCHQCHYLFVCQGGCPKHRFTLSPSGHKGHNYLCAGYQHFFKHITREMDILKDLLATGYSAESLMFVLSQERNIAADINRNSPCPCGSGKKYKRCCLKR